MLLWGISRFTCGEVCYGVGSCLFKESNIGLEMGNLFTCLKTLGFPKFLLSSLFVSKRSAAMEKVSHFLSDS